ncbi:MADS-box protein AGL42, partial [Mucuna pruriens]
QVKFDPANMAKKIELLELSIRKLLGQSASSCSYDELKGIEEQLHRSLQRVRQRKAQLYKEQIEQLQSQESNLLKENAELRAMESGLVKENAKLSVMRDVSLVDHRPRLHGI